MFDIPEKFKINKKIPIKDFIPKSLKLSDRKAIKEFVKSVTLSYQIMGEEIPSLIDESVNCQVIQFYTFEVTDTNKANKIANIYQELIKPFCVIKFIDNENERYSLAIKRLNKNDNSQIIVENSFLSEAYAISPIDISSSEGLDYSSIKNRTNKYNFYYEMFLKAYIIFNEKLYANIKKFLDNPIWYDIIKVKELESLLFLLSSKKEQIKKLNLNSDKMKINQEIRKIINQLDKF